MASLPVQMSSLSVRCGPSLWSAITRTLVGRVVSFMLGSSGIRVSERSGRVLPQDSTVPTGDPPVEWAGLLVRVASLASTPSTRRAWPRACEWA